LDLKISSGIKITIIFYRNPEAIWRLNKPTNGDAPFDIVLSNSGDDFAVMGMHFKLGLYEH
jgi:2-methylcitrate dehydratase